MQDPVSSASGFAEGTPAPAAPRAGGVEPRPGRVRRLVTAWPVVIAFLFTLVASLILAEQVITRNRLRATAEADLIADNIRRAGILNDLGASIQSESERHADLSAISNYLTNRDLGMSMKYGLAASLDAVERNLARHAHDRWDSRPSRILFFSEDQQLLADSSGDAALSIPEFPQAYPDTPWLAIDMKMGLLFATAPVMHKGRREGRVVTVLPASVLYRNALRQSTDQRRREILISTDGRELITVSNKLLLSPAMARAIRSTQENMVQRCPSAIAAVATEECAERHLVVTTRVPGLPFVLATIVDEDLAYSDSGSLPTMLISLLALVIIAFGLRKLHRANAHSAQLQLDLLESERQHVRDEQEARQQLASLYEEAKQASRAKSAFLANMSHEIRTPLNAIMGVTHLLLRKNYPDAWLNERLERVSVASAHLLTIINDILDLSRIEAGKLQLDDDTFLLDDLLNGKVVSLIREKAQEKGLNLSVTVDPVLSAPLRGDPLRLSQALLNYAANAVKFTERGSVAIRAIYLGENADGVTLRFEVADTGIGLDTARHANLFEAFEQGDSSRTREYGGSGLGLAITKRLVELMHGEVGVSSNQGEGSCFWFTARLQWRSSRATDRLSDTPAPSLRMLVLAGENATAQTLWELASTAGMQTRRATTLEAAVQAALDAEREGSGFDALLADWHSLPVDRPDALGALCGVSISSAPLLLVASPAGETQPASQALARIDSAVLLNYPLTRSTLHDALAPLRRAVIQPEPAGGAALTNPVGALPAGTRLLIVEDNPVNAEVVMEMLAPLGATIDLAGDGQAAVDKARQTNYDLVLMDMQMPVLDGLDATRQIRQLPGWASRPIIAMTANAFPEDQAACLGAGMNDHLSKPVDCDTLFACVLRWLSRSGQTQSAPTRTATDADQAIATVEAATPATKLVAMQRPSDEVIDVQVKTSAAVQAGVSTAPVEIRAVEQALRTPSRSFDRLLKVFNNRIDGVRRTLEHLRERHGDDAAQLRDRIRENDLQAAFRLAHAIKGMAAQVGQAELHSAAAEAEGLWRRGDAVPAPAFDCLLSELQRTLADVDAWLAKYPAGIGPAPAGGSGAAIDAHVKARPGGNPDAVPELARRLERMLDMADGDASTAADELLSALGPHAPAQQREQIAQIASLANRFALEEAAELLGQLMPDLTGTQAHPLSSQAS